LFVAAYARSPFDESEGGRQARIYSAGPIVKNRVLYLPDISYVPVTCGAVNGHRDVTDNPGLLEPVGD